MLDEETLLNKDRAGWRSAIRDEGSFVREGAFPVSSKHGEAERAWGLLLFSVFFVLCIAAFGARVEGAYCGLVGGRLPAWGGEAGAGYR